MTEEGWTRRRRGRFGEVTMEGVIDREPTPESKGCRERSRPISGRAWEVPVLFAGGGRRSGTGVSKGR